MNYGIPYMGSKSKIIKKLLLLFPAAENFYDLFGGGFSVTHGMLVHRSKSFKHFHFNEIRPGICKMIQDAIHGKYNYNVFKPKWISREEFNLKKDFDPFIKIIWSFGNHGSHYLFGKNIEQQKRSLHQAIVFNEFDHYAEEFFGFNQFPNGYSIKEKRLYCKERIKQNKSKRLDLQQLEQIERLQQLEQIERLEQLEQFKRLNFYSGSYDQVPILADSIIYCDIPYCNTEKYDNDFDRKKFLDWAHKQETPVFISEYAVNDSRFRCVWNESKRSLLRNDKSVRNKIEKVFVNRAGLAILLEKKNAC